MTETLSIFQADLIIRFAFTIISLLALLRVIYYRHSPNREALFGFTIFGCGVFLVTALLHNVEMSMGFAFGLFAVFSMLRYRTESISIRDMTYLFVVIVISLMSSVGPISLTELAIVNGTICILTAAAETSLFAARISEKKIVYEKIDNIHPNKYQTLLNDLHVRTGLDITTVRVGDVNYLQDTAILHISYKETTAARKTEKTTLLTNKQAAAI